MAGDPASGNAWVPDDPLDAVRLGDSDPFNGRVGGCGFGWWDHLDDPEHDPPWRCHRDPDHLGQHIATDPGHQVVAVHLSCGREADH